MLRPKMWQNTKAEAEFVPSVYMQLDNMRISSTAAHKCSLEKTNHEMSFPLIPSCMLYINTDTV